MDDRLIANELHHGSTQSSLACKSCRRKKLKCDRSLPQCRNCEKAARTCDYPAVAQKPGPRPGSHRKSPKAKRTSASNHRSATADTSQSLGTPDWSDSGRNSNTPSNYNHQNAIAENHVSWQPNRSTHIFNGISALNDISAFGKACQLMQIPVQRCLEMLKVYLDNMTSFSLFHQPTFHAKLEAIDSPKQIQALLTTILAFSIRFAKSHDLDLFRGLRPIDILDRACILEQECLSECQDEEPPLHLLQTLILQAHMSSVFGVRGRAWRLVGQAVRIAYELRLHELDLDAQDKANPDHTSSPTNTQDWILVEEKRRAWWATWECDIFASTILRLPNAIDWTRNRTNLPSSDEDWFNGNPQRSCYLNIDPNRRWRDVRDSGNTSPTTWFILLNSYKWESLSATQRIAPPTTFFDREDHLKDHFGLTDYKTVFARKREMLENCVRCAMASVPADLNTNDFLSFRTSQTSYPSLSLSRDHGRYMIHMMSQVTQLMISRKDLEGGNFVAYPADFTMGPTSSDSEHQQFRVPPTGSTERKRWQRCLMIADKMASIVRNACPDHYKHVNPNAATALWMGAATQLASMTYHRDEIDVDLARSNIDLLTTTIESFIRFWDLPRTLIVSLNTLEAQLRALSGKANATVAVAVAGAVESEVRSDQSADVMDSRRDVDGGMPGMEPAQSMPDMPDLTSSESTLELSPFDVLQAMDFGAMYNGVEGWENLFLDPGFQTTDFGY